MPVADSTTQVEKEKSASPASSGRPNLPHIDISEKGVGADGKPDSLDRRLFMQFSAYGGCTNIEAIKSRLQQNDIQAVLYQDINDPQGIGLLAYCEQPSYLIEEVQPLLAGEDFQELTLKPEYTTLGRTYSIGYESDLHDVLLHRPVKRVCDPTTPWIVWYPVRRSGMFERQPREDQRKMLMEHGGIGHAYGKAGFATDIRLAGHGLNKNDNDFIVGLLGKELFPLSALVQHMRKTRQTSEFIESMGPFFVGHVLWQPQPELKK